jgi:hypothetical protein
MTLQELMKRWLRGWGLRVAGHRVRTGLPLDLRGLDSGWWKILVGSASRTLLLAKESSDVG